MRTHFTGQTHWNVGTQRTRGSRQPKLGWSTAGPKYRPRHWQPGGRQATVTWRRDATYNSREQDSNDVPPQHRGAMRSLMSGGTITDHISSKHFKLGGTGDCQICGDATGSLEHTLWHCPGPEHKWGQMGELTQQMLTGGISPILCKT